MSSRQLSMSVATGSLWHWIQALGIAQLQARTPRSPLIKRKDVIGSIQLSHVPLRPPIGLLRPPLRRFRSPAELPTTSELLQIDLFGPRKQPGLFCSTALRTARRLRCAIDGRRHYTDTNCTPSPGVCPRWRGSARPSVKTGRSFPVDATQHTSAPG